MVRLMARRCRCIRSGDSMTRTARALFALGSVNLLGRGTDYLFSPHTAAPEEITSIAPLAAWGIICLVAAGLIIFGLVASHVRMVLTGAALAAAAYTAFAIQRFVLFIDTYPLQDWREVVVLVSGAASWAVLIISTTIRNAVVEARSNDGGCYAGRRCIVAPADE